MFLPVLIEHEASLIHKTRFIVIFIFEKNPDI